VKNRQPRKNTIEKVSVFSDLRGLIASAREKSGAGEKLARLPSRVIVSA
jgi:hypothetical protein